MNNTNNKLKLLISAFFLLGMIGNIHAQDPIKWYVVAGSGVADMRNFTYSMKDFGYNNISVDNNNEIQEDKSVSYRFKNKPILLGSAGIGASGVFSKESIVGWDAQLNLRTSGFKILVANESVSNIIPEDPFLPQIGKTELFRSWSLHLPLSITLLPFEVVGFTIGADVLYELTKNPAAPDKQNRSPLTRHLGSTRDYSYAHPFTVGAHLGIFVPINKHMQVDATVFTDVAPRLRFQRNAGINDRMDTKFREMALAISIKYNLDW